MVETWTKSLFSGTIPAPKQPIPLFRICYYPGRQAVIKCTCHGFAIGVLYRSFKNHIKCVAVFSANSIGRDHGQIVFECELSC